MQEIRCPKCGEVFQVDETGYSQIAHQVRDKEFERELERRKRDLEDKHEQALQVIRLEEKQEYTASITQKDLAIAEKDKIIAELQSKLDANEMEKNIAIAEAMKQNEEEHSKSDKKYTEEIAQKATAISNLDKKIIELQAKIESNKTAQELAITKAIESKNEELSQKDNEIAELKCEIKNKENENLVSKNSMQEQYEAKLKLKDEQIEYYKDFKAKQSTKMIGESLEQHCLTQFNSLRMTAFPKAYFEKDNDARTGSKGDFIYRESDENGVEFISIMFEMKNEADETATKHKNEDFFKELDKDRNEKKCEYAILVSLLEIDSELYGNGIVDVSYKYPKMYVIRPQFFIPIITLLRNAALNSLQYKQELQVVRNQQVDVQNFEDNINNFKTAFARNYKLASEKFKTAIEEIEKTISHLQKTREALISSENNLRLANNKADELSIKKLTKNAPTVAILFDNSENKS